MTRRVHVLQALRELPGTVEVVAIGGVRRPSGQAHEPEIAVVVAVDPDRPGFNPQVDARTIWVGCGQLDLLLVGSRWRRGRRVGSAPAVHVEAEYQLIRPEWMGEGEHPQPPGARPYPNRAGRTASGFLLKRVDKPRGGRDKRPETVLLPAAELLRGIFGVSSRLLVEMFSGIREGGALPDHGLIYRGRSGRRSDGTVKITAARALSDQEATMVAALITDRRLLRLHDSVFQQLSVRRAWRAYQPVDFAPLWPWSEPVRLDLEGRWVKFTDRKRFVATRITRLDLPLPFERVEVHFPSTDRPGPNAPPKPPGGARSPNAQVIVVTTARAPSPAWRPSSLPSRAGGLTVLGDVEIVHVAGAGMGGSDRRGPGGPPRDEVPFGTASRQPGGDADVARLEVARPDEDGAERAARARSEALAKTWAALTRACGDDGWTLEALPLESLASGVAEHGGLNFMLEPLVARVSVGPKSALVMDMGSTTGDERSLGVIVPRSAGMSDADVEARTRTVGLEVRGRWRSSLLNAPDLDVIAVNRRPETWANPEGYADLLKRKIALALGL